MATQKLFVRIKGRILGPIPMEKAIEMASIGKIQPEHQISFDRYNWQPAAVVPQLFPETRSIEAAPESSLPMSSIPWDQIKLDDARPALAENPQGPRSTMSQTDRHTTREVLERAADKTADIVDVPTHLIPAIFSTLCCCLPGGIVAIIYSIKTSNCLQKGDVDGANIASSYAYLWVTISALTWAIAFLLSLFASLVLLYLGK
jgi:hypothetical protein